MCEIIKGVINPLFILTKLLPHSVLPNQRPKPKGSIYPSQHHRPMMMCSIGIPFAQSCSKLTSIKLVCCPLLSIQCQFVLLTNQMPWFISRTNQMKLLLRGQLSSKTLARCKIRRSGQGQGDEIIYIYLSDTLPRLAVSA